MTPRVIGIPHGLAGETGYGSVLIGGAGRCPKHAVLCVSHEVDPLFGLRSRSSGFD